MRYFVTSTIETTYSSHLLQGCITLNLCFLISIYLTLFCARPHRFSSGDRKPVRLTDSHFQSCEAVVRNSHFSKQAVYTDRARCGAMGPTLDGSDIVFASSFRLPCSPDGCGCQGSQTPLSTGRTGRSVSIPPPSLHPSSRLSASLWLYILSLVWPRSPALKVMTCTGSCPAFPSSHLTFCWPLCSYRRLDREVFYGHPR